MSSSKSGEEGSGKKSVEDQNEWRKYNWKKKDGWWTCDLVQCFSFKFQDEKGKELRRTDRQYRGDDLENEKGRLVRSVLQIATALRQKGDSTYKGLSDHDIVAKILQDNDNPVPVLKNLAMYFCDIESLRPFLDAAMAGKLFKLKSLELGGLSREESTPIGSLPCGEYLAKVVGSGKLPNLAKFEVGEIAFESNEVKSLFDSLKAIGGSLRELILYRSVIETQCHWALAKVIQSGHLLHLENLSLHHTAMTSAALEAYSTGLVHLPALKELHFSRNLKLEAPGHVALAEAMDSGHLLALESLDLSSTNMDVGDCSAYAKAFSSGRLPALTEINFSDNRKLGDEDAKALSLAFASGHMGKLQTVHLVHCNIGDAGLEAICRAMGAGHLRELRNLSSSVKWSEKCLDGLGSAIASGGLDSLLHLNLFWRDTDDEIFLQKHLNPFQGDMDAEIFLPVLSAISQNKSFIATVSTGNDGMDLQLDQLRENNLQHVQIMKDLGDSDKSIPVPIVPATHGKIYLCGNPEAGKTTLRRTLLRSAWESLFMWQRRPHREDRTRGIAVSQLESEGKDGVSLSIWDMAGQSEYHLVHHAFLRDLAFSDAERTFFIVVCRSQDNMKNVDNELEYWLWFIASGCRKGVQTPRSVFVVLNRDHGDSRVLEQMNGWKLYLDNMKEKFKGYLNIYTENENQDMNRWKVHLNSMKVKFKRHLRVDTAIQNQNLFVMDVRRRQSVLSLKRSVIEESKRMITYIPEICQQIQIEVNVWKKKMQFPVLHWDEFLKKVNEIVPQWMEKTVDAATRCLNEAGLILYINKEFPADWQIPHTRLVILDPNWICAEVVGNIFVPENLKKKIRSEELKVNPNNGAVSIKDLKDFFKTENFEWQESDLQDVIVILLWLGLCFKGREGYLFIPCLIETDVDPISLKQSHHMDDQWVMGYSVGYKESDIGLAPIALWHSLQVLLAQTIEYNGKDLGNDFTVRKHSVSFKCKQMVVFIQVNVSNNHPTFSSIDFFVKPIDRDADTTKESQVDLAYKLVQILCKLWGEICPGIGHVKKVVWPWPASCPKPDFTDSEVKHKCWEVSSIKMKVLENGMGMTVESRVGDAPSGKITYDQLLCGEDIEDVVRSLKGELQKKVFAWNSEMEEGIKLGVFPDDVLKKEGVMQGTKGAASTSRDFITRKSFKPVEAEQLKSMTPTEQILFEYLEYIRRLDEHSLTVAHQIQEVALDNQRMIREVYKELHQVKMQQELALEKLQNFQQLFLENEEQSCPRFIYLVTKNSGRSVVTTLKDAKSRISPTVKFHIRFLCEAPYDAAGKYGQHAVEDDLQEGIDISMLKDWGRKLAPWLKVSLTVLSISAKVAANIFAPGVGAILPNLGDYLDNKPSTLEELIVAGTGYIMSDLDNLMNEGQEPNSASSSFSLQELSGSTRKEMTKKLRELSVSDFERKIGLSKVCLQQVGGSSSSVLWICSQCKSKYSQSSKISHIFELQQ